MSASTRAVRGSASQAQTMLSLATTRALSLSLITYLSLSSSFSSERLFVQAPSATLRGSSSFGRFARVSLRIRGTEKAPWTRAELSSAEIARHATSQVRTQLTRKRLCHRFRVNPFPNNDSSPAKRQSTISISSFSSVILFWEFFTTWRPCFGRVFGEVLRIGDLRLAPPLCASPTSSTFPCHGEDLSPRPRNAVRVLPEATRVLSTCLRTYLQILRCIHDYEGAGA